MIYCQYYFHDTILFSINCICRYYFVKSVFTFKDFYAILNTMDISKLEAVGLSKQQALAYALLVEKVELRPAAAASLLKTTRTNAYKLFDKLVELRLASKEEVGRTFQYRIANPMALASLAADYRAKATAREEAARQVMTSLLDSYYGHASVPAVEVVSGPKALADLYRNQIKLGEDLHFIRTRSDVPNMGFETMHEIRTTPSMHGLKRSGILTVNNEKSTNNKESHKRSDLEVTWLEEAMYDAPVEWSVTKSSLLICSYGQEPQGVLIVDRFIASAFLQLWSLLQTLLEPRSINKTLNKLH